MQKVIKWCNANLSNEYIECINNILNDSKFFFDSDLVSIVLGGSCGKNLAIDGWSDIDIYIVLKKIDYQKITKFLNKIYNYNIHIGTTYYTPLELKKGLIDNKTRIMVYEKQNYGVHPSLFGEEDLFNVVNYFEIIDNDKKNLPNVLQKLRRMYTNVLNNKYEINKVYVKTLFLGIKCFLNTKEIFTLGYRDSLICFLELYNKDLTVKVNFDILDLLNILEHNQENKTKLIELTNIFLNYVSNIMEEI